MLLNGKTTNQIREDKDDVTVDRLASVGQIAAGIAHEVRNPLTAVKGFLQLLKKEHPHAYIDIASEELENALATMQNLLNVSKPDLDDEGYSFINLCSELEAILYLFQDKVYNVEIIKKFENYDVNIYGRKNQLKKAFFNLLKNSFEAIPDSGTITIKHYINNEHLVVSISDTGVGIPEEKINMLGTPFFTSKETGTGMGLTQVYSTIYEHHGMIEATSEVGLGTNFTIYFPIQQNNGIGVMKLNLVYEEQQTFNEFYLTNREVFNDLLTRQSRELFERIKENNEINDQFILNSTHKVIEFLHEANEYGLIMHAKEQGKKWAMHDIELILILEWFQMVRKIYWDFLANYYEQQIQLNLQEFFDLERRVNYNLDSYIKHFSSSFSEYSQELIQSQNELIDDLNVPIIPLYDTMAILPIIGAVDTRRAKNIQVKLLEEIHNQSLKHIIIDLSGVAYLDTAVLGHLFKIINGIRIQGCKAVLTGIRPEITNTIVELGIELNEKVETKGTLQQAIQDYNESLKELSR
ncbi:ATP-binding protein [Alkalihalobacterium chitinilyticum]|uniref:histidine kinase n=1 Tax=Alkalihalobacterium chitinilyticum TaxID=2980103 RepID=A0ABT5VDS5_9BACI|nr:ATP-binding protein [Alkalihalobacterium chitinilyticum]MDE5413477.1 ATP-binding protein [Alkalihalobacterium chitinilyticum]